MTGESNGLILEMHGDIKVIREKVTELEKHQRETNGRLGSLERRDDEHALAVARVDGAIAFGRWVLGITLAVMSVGAAVAGVILGYVAKGG